MESTSKDYPKGEENHSDKNKESRGDFFTNLQRGPQIDPAKFAEIIRGDLTPENMKILNECSRPPMEKDMMARRYVRSKKRVSFEENVENEGRRNLKRKRSPSPDSRDSNDA